MKLKHFIEVFLRYAQRDSKIIEIFQVMKPLMLIPGSFEFVISPYGTQDVLSFSKVASTGVGACISSLHTNYVKRGLVRHQVCVRAGGLL